MIVRIGLLECDHVDDPNRGVAGDYRDMFAASLAPVAPQVELVAYDVCRGEVPESVHACDAWVATGSRRSAYEPAEWIERTGAFVRDVHRTGATFVGVCFGHQLLAQVLGGRVERADSGWGVGVHTMEVCEPQSWMRPPERRCELLFMHQDQVSRLPDEGVLLASTDHCPIAMFRVRETMLGIQAHPEFEPTYLATLLDERSERIGAARVAAARASLGRPLANRTIARWIVRFIESAARSRPETAGPTSR